MRRRARERCVVARQRGCRVAERLVQEAGVEPDIRVVRGIGHARLASAQSVVRPSELVQDRDRGLSRIAVRRVERCGPVEGLEGLRQLAEGVVADAAQEVRGSIAGRGPARIEEVRQRGSELTPLDERPRGSDE